MSKQAQFDLAGFSAEKSNMDAALREAGSCLESYLAAPALNVNALEAMRDEVRCLRDMLKRISLDGAAVFCAEMETVLNALFENPVMLAALHGDVLRRALSALTHYLDALFRDADAPALHLFPQYQELQQLRGLEMAFEQDLFFPAMAVSLPEGVLNIPRQGDALVRVKAARSHYQQWVLRYLRQNEVSAALQEMQQAIDIVLACMPQDDSRAFWWVASGLLDCVRLDGLPEELNARKLFGQIDRQMYAVAEGNTLDVRTAMREMLYLIGRSRNVSERVAQIKQQYALAKYFPVSSRLPPDEAARLLGIMYEQYRLTEESWEECALGDTGALMRFIKSVKKLVQLSEELDPNTLQPLIRQIQAVSLQVSAPEQVRPIAMDMAMALLLLENGIVHYDHLSYSFQEQASILSERMQAALSQQPESAPRLSELIGLHGRMQGDAALVPLGKEMLINLRQVKQGLECFFSDASKRDALNGLQQQLAQVRGGLRFLPLEQVEKLEAAIQDSVRFFKQGNAAKPIEELTLPDAMSVLENYLQYLMHGQKNDAAHASGAVENRHEAFEKEGQEALGILSALENFLLHLIQAQKNDLTELLASLEVLSKLHQIAESAVPEPVKLPAVAIVRQRPPAEDQELIEVFLEEAQEALVMMRSHLDACLLYPDSGEPLSTIRRGFHTLKGSGRMVGLTDLGEVAWVIERAMNKWLRDSRPASAGLLHFLNQAIQAFTGWVETLKSQGSVEVEADELIAMAQQVEQGIDPEEAGRHRSLEVFEPQAAESAVSLEPEQVVIGEVKLSSALFNISSVEAKQNALVLEEQLTALQQVQPPHIQYDFMRAAHTLAGVSRTMGFTDVARLAHGLESWLQARMEQPFTLSAPQLKMLGDAIVALQDMVQNICDRKMPVPRADLLDQLLADKDRLREEVAKSQAADVSIAQRDLVLPELAMEAGRSEIIKDETPAAPVSVELEPAQIIVPAAAWKSEAPVKEEKLQVRDDVDEQLLPVFLAEADELNPKIGAGLRAWHENPNDPQQSDLLKRWLHTLKGSARMAGAMRVGEIAHAMEDRVLAAAKKRGQSGYWDELEDDFDRIANLLEELRSGKVNEAEEGIPVAEERSGIEHRAERRAVDAGAEHAHSSNVLRVRSDVVDRLVNEAGEISVARSRMETEMSAFKSGLLELSGSVSRLRNQLREVEIQAESQMQARVQLQKNDADQFDPLEFDRFTRLQELTRIMNESVHDVQTVQQSLLRNFDETAAAMSAQARLNRELQQGLMNVRMVPFSSISERLYRIVRQTGKELNKRVNLELYGTGVELDRSVLEKMTAPFEHLLRNAIAHGLESEALRIENGKAPIGEIRLSLRQESNDVVFECSDDGAGLNYEALREKAAANGTLKEDEAPSEEKLAQLIFTPGISTATEVTEVAGRGIGMDVVRSEITALGGRIDVSSLSSQGTQFTIHLPLTLAVMQILTVRGGDAVYAIPSTMVAQVRQVKSAEMAAIYSERQVVWQNKVYPLHYLLHLLGDVERVAENQPRNSLLLLHSGEQRIALHVDALLGNQETVVKNMGPQLARMPGIAGTTVLGDGAVVLILNPTQLAQRNVVAAASVSRAASEKLRMQPLVMVVDDSLTVRIFSSRLLTRAGYQVVTAKDGLDALDQLTEISPDVVLLDIEMPRMDGFELTKRMREDPGSRDIPIIMITSRIAEKHRSYAHELGVDAYLGKPYQEEELLQHIAALIAKRIST